MLLFRFMRLLSNGGVILASVRLSDPPKMNDDCPSFFPRDPRFEFSCCDLNIPSAVG
jgi:hypothetical protein